MDTPEIQLLDVSPAFVLGVAHTLYQVLGERAPGRVVRGPTGREHFIPGPVVRQPGFAVYHPFKGGSDDEYSYDQGRVFAAQKLQEEIQASAMQLQKGQNDAH